MNLSIKRLQAFTRKFERRGDLFDLRPEQMNLNRYQQPANDSIMTNVTVDSGLPQNIMIFRHDDNIEEWDVDTTKMSTLAWLEGLEKTGYVFEGFISSTDLRLWFRHMWGIEGLDDPALPPPDNQAADQTSAGGTA